MSGRAQLHLKNSSTNEEELFVSKICNEIRWFVTGPTLCETMNLGHARYYVSIDIIRRILMYHFAYEVVLCMNMVDMNDKIIEYVRNVSLVTCHGEIGSIETPQMITYCRNGIKQLEDVRSREPDPDKRSFYKKQIRAAKKLLKEADRYILSDNETEPNKSSINDSDRLSFFSKLIFICTSNLLDNTFFHEQIRNFDEQFELYMKLLNVLPPSMATRTSDYISEMIKLIEKIIDNGCAYECNSTIYLDTSKFRIRRGFSNLESRQNDIIDELTKRANEYTSPTNTMINTKNSSDFILWNNSQFIEPAWKSSWGFGSPAWLVQSAAMAYSVLSCPFDIYTAPLIPKSSDDINEITLFQAVNNNDSCIGYYLYVANITLSEDKTSSSKNIMNLSEVLLEYNNDDIRFLFLLNNYDETIHFNAEIMNKIVKFKTSFIYELKQMQQHLTSEGKLIQIDYCQKLNENDLVILHKFRLIKHNIFKSMCDSINTKDVMHHLEELIQSTSVYINSEGKTFNNHLLKTIFNYIIKLLKIFGILFAESLELKD
ncbi:unnamed protein product [Rotaria sp. Silwood2]|nr:unnamed protein product [Rotaria sp. Silwood2]CAF4347963.1 unnamed protein product [Rotaria sp. Silwood2]